MSNLKNYADLILKDDIILSREKLDPIFEDISNEIFLCSYRRNNRSLESVRKSVNKMALEYALDAIGIPINSKPFDYRDPDSYAYDNILRTDTFECKNFHNTFFSYKPEWVQTFRKNINLINYFASGTVDITEDQYIVRFMFLANAKTFFNYERQSKYPDARLSLYYNHHHAARDGQAIIRR